MRLAVVPVAVDGDEQLRLDLAEAVEHALFAEIGRAGRPDRADRGGGEHGGDGLGHVRHHRRDAVALARRHGAEEPAAAARPARAARPRTGARATLSSPRKTSASPSPRLRQQVLGEVQLRVGEEAGAGHPVAIVEHARALVADDAAEIPDEVPERLAVLDRPGVQRVIVAQFAACGRRGLAGKGSNGSRLDILRFRGPERRCLGHAGPPRSGRALEAQRRLG